MFSCFTDKTFLKKFLKISLPIMISAFITFLVSFIDNIMVGTVSNEAVSGVYAANQVTYIFNLAAFGLLEGAGIFIQQFVGSNDKSNLKQSFCYKIIVAIIFMIIALPIVYFFGKYVIDLYSKSDKNHLLIYNEGLNYLYIIAISYIPFMIGYLYQTTLREIGETKIAMYSSVIAIIANCTFNFLFISVFKMGVIGAASATIIARTLEMAFLILICHNKKYEFCHNVFKEFKVKKSLFMKITKIGIVLFINEIGYSVGMVLQSLAFSQRDGVLSSISIVTTISNIIVILINGLSVGIGVMVGNDLGAGDFEQAKKDNFKLNLLGLYLSIFSGIILISLSFVIPNIFKEVVFEQKRLASYLIIIYSSFLWANTLAVTSYMTLKTGGKSGLTFFFDSGLMILLYIPISWFLAKSTSMPMIYIYLIIRSLDVLKAILGILFIKKGTWIQNLTKI